MFKKAFVILLTLSSPFPVSSAVNNFDLMCGIYIEAINTTMPLTEKYIYIDTRIKATVKGEARGIYLLKSQVDPADRYNIVVKVAEHELKKPWSCKAMKQILDTVE